MSVGTNIKKRRMELHLSQQELADAMGYRTRSTIAKIESGENDVSQKKLQRFAAVLDTTVASLIAGSQETIHPAEPSAIYDPGRNKNIVIILAGGRSGHNRQNIPSQFVNIHGKPVLVWCLEAYQNHPAVDDIYIVCLKGWEGIAKAYAGQYGFTKVRGLIAASNSGMASLKNALDAIYNRYTPEDMIIIQEATRPLVSMDTISHLLQSAQANGSATLCHSMQDYVQFELSGAGAKYVNRDSLIAIQSPEAHRLSLLKEVFGAAQQRPYPLTESCCTMLFYNLGYRINFIESHVNNIKIARDEDIAAFSTLIKNG